MSLGGGEILVVLVLALLVFGPKRLPEIGRQIGGAMREMRKMQDTVKREIADVLDTPVESAGAPAPSIVPAADAAVAGSSTGAVAESALDDPGPPPVTPDSGSFH